MCVFPRYPLKDNEDPAISLSCILTGVHFRDKHNPLLQSNCCYLNHLCLGVVTRRAGCSCAMCSFFLFACLLNYLGMLN